MSYGWLTESSLLPKKQVKIDVESKTFVDLKIHLLKEKEKLKRKDGNKNNHNYQTNSIIKTKLNLKNQQDLKSFDVEEEQPNMVHKIQMELKEPEFSDFERIKDHLTKKELIYEKLKNSKAKDLEKEDSLKELKESCLIDFDYKRIEEKRKRKFNMLNINQNNSNEETNINTAINSEISYNLNLSKQKVLVKQSYDKTLTESEKTALDSILEEETDYKKKIEFLKRKKNLEREERLERIKKMKIEDDSNKFN